MGTHTIRIVYQKNAFEYVKKTLNGETIKWLMAENLELKSRLAKVEFEVVKLARAVEKLLET